MTTDQGVQKRSKAHQRYKTSDGRPCVGVTTVTGKIAKPYLVNWANKLGLDGYDVSTYVDALARIGTLAHYLIECDIKGSTPDVKDYTANELESAQGSFKKWLDWKAKNNFKLIQSEFQMVDDKLQYGGTCDIYAEVNGKKCILDIKTSKSCYSEHRTQVVAYGKLAKTNGLQVDEVRILRVGRSENEGFEDVLVGGVALHWKRFQAYLKCYWIDKSLDNAGA